MREPMSEREQQLLQLVLTTLRETSPQSAPAFQPEEDLPRLYHHLHHVLRELRLEPPANGTPPHPAVMRIPAAPARFTILEEDAWLLGWYAGYTAAWRVPPITLTDTG